MIWLQLNHYAGALRKPLGETRPRTVNTSTVIGPCYWVSHEQHAEVEQSIQTRFAALKEELPDCLEDADSRSARNSVPAIARKDHGNFGATENYRNFMPN